MAERLGPPREWIDEDPRFWLDKDLAGRLEFWFEHTCVDGRTAERLPLWDGGWKVMMENPLTISPSVDCKGCGLHGHITSGRWEPVREPV